MEKVETDLTEILKVMAFHYALYAICVVLLVEGARHWKLALATSPEALTFAPLATLPEALTFDICWR